MTVEEEETLRRIICYIATSADGYIARPDGDVGWLPAPGDGEDYGYADFYATIDTILWGRKTYDQVLTFQEQGIPGAAFDEKVKNYVFSRQPPASHPGDVEFVTEPIPAFVESLRAGPGKDIWMMGGAGLIGSFLDAGALDAFIIHKVPVFIGEGIPLIAPRHLDVPLNLESSHAYADGVLRLEYSVGIAADRRPASNDLAEEGPVA